MASAKFGFIGTGNMGSALARAVVKSVGGPAVLLTDKNQRASEILAQELGCSYGELSTVALNSKFIFLGVKPQVLPDVVKALKPYLDTRSDRFVLVSMAAGVEISTLQRLFVRDYPIIRIMPNTPVSVGKGMILYATSKEVFLDEVGEFTNALKFAGLIDKLPENLIDAASAVSGCGPAFVYMFAESMADAGVEAGLTRDKALLYAAQTLSGASELMLKTKKHPAVLKDEVCSPGGSTIAGVHSLEADGFKGDVMNAVKASFERTKELGK